jgi:GGDEF domain-containing protein
VWHALSSTVRQTDVVVKYTASSLVFILPDTSYENAKKLAEKLRQIAFAIRPPWGEAATISAVVAEASARPNDDAEDRVTEWINRAEAGLESLRHQSGNVVVEMAVP